MLEEATGARIGRVYQHLQGRNVGMMSANRGEYTAEENRERNRNLEGDIKRHGLGFIKVKGRYVENKGTDHERPVDEHSYLVIGPKGDDKGRTRGFMLKHGAKYEQDSVLYKGHDEADAALHGTREGGFPGKGQTHNVGQFHPNRADEFHSLLKGRAFSFASLEISFEDPTTFFSRPRPSEDGSTPPEGDSTGETAGTYTRSPLRQSDRRFKRWLVICDISPDAGPISGFDTIALPNRTLNVMAKIRLSDAIQFIRDSSRLLRQMQRENTYSTFFRYQFCLIDLWSQTTVDRDQIEQWASFNATVDVESGVTPLETQRAADFRRAGNLVRNLSGKEAPMPVLLDNQDPIRIMRNLNLFTVAAPEETPNDNPSAGQQIYLGAVSPDVYNTAVKTALTNGNRAWIIGLPTLPGLIADSLDRTIQRKVKSLVRRLELQGLQITNPRYLVIPMILDRLLARTRSIVMAQIYAEVIKGEIDYSTENTLDNVTLSVLELMIFPSLPGYLQPDPQSGLYPDQYAATPRAA